MAGQYFRIIKTQGPLQDDVRRIQEEKLNNYLKYDWPESNDNLGLRNPITYEKEVKHMSTSTCMQGNSFVITTTLCCEDEHEGGEGY